MRERPNAAVVTDANTSDSRPNDLYRSLERTFEHLLQSEDPDRYPLVGDLYVPHPHMEQVLLGFCSREKENEDFSASGAAFETSAAAFLIGATGIGKSTLIRHILHVNRNVCLDKGTLLIPFSLNQRHIETSTQMRQQMSAVFQQAVWIAKGGEEQYSDQDFLEIAQFLRESSPDLLNNHILDLTLPLVERTKKLAQNAETTYAFSQVALKYYATKNKEIKRIVLIIDDVEGKSSELQVAAITNSLETRECLLNTATARQVSIRLLIALRPETHIWASQLAQVRTVEFRELLYNEPVSLFDIFERRFNAVFSRDDYAHIRDKERLDQALSVLRAVGDVLSEKFSSRFVRLNNYNIRASLETFRLIVCNRRWLQRDSEWRPFFVVEEHNFAISQAAVIRAIGLGEGEVYPQRRTCIANLLYNTREPSSDLLLLYITKFLRMRSQGTVSEMSLTETFQKLLGNSFDPHLFKEMIEYGLRHGLIHRETAHDHDRLSETARSNELYAMLNDSTLVLELYRDDICQPLRNLRALRPTMALGGAQERFAAVASLIRQMWESETRLRKVFSTQGATEAGSSYVGNEFEAARMRTGFWKSVDAFYRSAETRPSTVVDAVDSLRKLIVPSELSYFG